MVSIRKKKMGWITTIVSFLVLAAIVFTIAYFASGKDATTAAIATVSTMAVLAVLEFISRRVLLGASRDVSGMVSSLDAALGKINAEMVATNSAIREANRARDKGAAQEARGKLERLADSHSALKGIRDLLVQSKRPHLVMRSIQKTLDEGEIILGGERMQQRAEKAREKQKEIMQFLMNTDGGEILVQTDGTVHPAHEA